MSDREFPTTDLPRLASPPLTRRRFLGAVGVLQVGAVLPKALFASGPLKPETALSKAPPRPRVGALFNPYHNPFVWMLLARQRPEGMPLLGSYSGTAVGSVDTQIIWAQTMGLSFLLAAYCPGSSREGVDALFEAARRSSFPIGLYLDLANGSARASRRPLYESLAAAIEEIAPYRATDCYLRTPAGEPIVAVAGVDDGDRLSATLAALGDRDSMVVWRLPAAWRYVPSVADDADLARAIERREIYPGFSVRRSTAPALRPVFCHSRQAAAGLVSLMREPGGTLRLPEFPRGVDAPEYILLDSFNQWGISAPLEPGTRSRLRYGRQVRSWIRADAS